MIIRRLRYAYILGQKRQENGDGQQTEQLEV